MKQILSLTLVLLMIFSMCFLASCADKDEEEMLYTEDTTLGEGSKTITFIVSHIDGTGITFTIKTDKAILSEALLEHKLIEGEMGAFGIYIKKVNGITQDFDIDQTYWALYVGNDYAVSGAESTAVVDGETYMLKASR